MATDLGLRRRNVGSASAASAAASAYDPLSREQREDEQGNSCCGCLGGAIGAIGSFLHSKVFDSSEYKRLGYVSDAEYRESLRAQAEYEKISRPTQENQDELLARSLEQEQQQVEQDEVLARSLEQEGSLGGPSSHPLFRSSSSSSSSAANASASVRGLLEDPRAEQLERLYSSKALYRVPYCIACGVGRGIENMNNSCTIASLLYAMFATTDFFDRLLLVGSETEDDRTKLIRQTLIEIANGLRSVEGRVDAETLNNLRVLVMGNNDGTYLQPDEFLEPLFKALGFNWNNDDEVTFFSVPTDRLLDRERAIENTPNIQTLMTREENNRNLFRVQFPLRSDGANIISSFNNQVLFIHMPRQAATGFMKESQPYGAIIPSLELIVERQKYRLHSIVANEEGSHYVSYVIKPDERQGNKVCYFNGGGNGREYSQVTPLPHLYEVLTGDHPEFLRDSNLQAWYNKLCIEATMFVYVRDEG